MKLQSNKLESDESYGEVVCANYFVATILATEIESWVTTGSRLLVPVHGRKLL